MKRLLASASYGLDQLVAFRDQFLKNVHSADGMRLTGRRLNFLSDPKFLAAYSRGMNSGHHILRPKGSTEDIHIEFRVYIECWAAQYGLHLDGDFVCCGVNTGIMPLAVCEYIDINSTDKHFWLFDTFCGIPENQMLPSERRDRITANAEYYSECFEVAQRNFAPYHKVNLIKGMVPDTLSTTNIQRVSYLSIDMNIAYPERKAIEYFWPKLSSGAIVILDDYGFASYREQSESIDDFAAHVGTNVLTLPTGQGLIIKV
jgi:O-methyltransferase